MGGRLNLNISSLFHTTSIQKPLLFIYIHERRLEKRVVLPTLKTDTCSLCWLSLVSRSEDEMPPFGTSFPMLAIHRRHISTWTAFTGLKRISRNQKSIHTHDGFNSFHKSNHVVFVFYLNQHVKWLEGGFCMLLPFSNHLRSEKSAAFDDVEWERMASKDGANNLCPQVHGEI